MPTFPAGPGTGAELHQQLALIEDTPAQPFPWFHASLSNLLSATVGWL